MTKLLIIGTGGHAKVCLDAVICSQSHNVIGFIDDFRQDKLWMGYKVHGKVSDIPSLPLSDFEVFVAIGDNFLREQVIDRLIPMKIPFATIIHPKAIVSDDAVVEHGAVIMAGAILAKWSYAEAFSIVNHGASLDHDSILSNFASLAPGSHVGGNCVIGRSSAVCIGAAVSNGVVIGDHTVIGAGSVVLNHMDNEMLCYGVPCKPIRKREKGEAYLSGKPL